MEEKKYLDEQTFQKNKKMLMRISLIILIVGVLIGGSIIVTGIIKNQKENNLKTNDKVATNKRTESEVQADIDNTQTKISDLNKEIAQLDHEQTKAFHESGFSEKYNEIKENARAKREEKNILSSKIAEYEFELQAIKMGLNNVKDEINSTIGKINKTNSMGYYMAGVFILFATFIISGALFLTAKKREITAFGVQQAMPVAQEGAEKIAPSIGNIAKEITKGVEEGKK
ncbi:MAG: hypothetical protein RR255_01970 [Bacilli bacterium]